MEKSYKYEHCMIYIIYSFVIYLFKTIWLNGKHLHVNSDYILNSRADCSVLKMFKNPICVQLGILQNYSELGAFLEQDCKQYSLSLSSIVTFKQTLRL